MIWIHRSQHTGSSRQEQHTGLHMGIDGEECGAGVQDARRSVRRKRHGQSGPPRVPEPEKKQAFPRFPEHLCDLVTSQMAMCACVVQK